MESDRAIHISVGTGVGRFRIGSLINDVIALMSNQFPRTSMDIDLHYQTDASPENIHVYIPEWGISLRFQSHSQKLYMIDIVDCKKLAYSLNGTVFSAEEPATLKSLQKALGPSFPGKNDVICVSVS